MSEVNHTVSEVGLIGEFHGSRLLVAGVLVSGSEFEERTQVGFHMVFYAVPSPFSLRNLQNTRTPQYFKSLLSHVLRNTIISYKL